MVTIAVIDINLNELQRLVGNDVTVEELEQEGSMLGILFEESDDGVAVEVEPNRPDLLSVEGIARALKGFFEIETGAVDYDVEEGDVTVTVDDSVADVRRFITCARITGLELDQESLDSLIQLQEKLTETYGRKREKIAIGLHDFTPVNGKITYKAVDPNEFSFVPLGNEDEMTLTEILENHEKGQEYGWILEDTDAYPVIVDADGTVLSFPPVINGVATAVSTDTTDLFLDVTGTSQDEVETALNILVAALHERGGSIESVTVDGKDYPDMSRDVHDVDPDYVQRISGLDDLSGNGMADELAKLRYAASVDGDQLIVEVPAYRADIMHDYDIIEDVVIGYGYDNVDAEIPAISTIGGQTGERVFIDRLREFMIGAGAQELMTFILSNQEKLFEKMDLDTDDVVSMANPLTEDYAVVRPWLLPSLMETLSDNQHNRYPQDLFEVGLCSRLSDETATGAADGYKLAYVHADVDAGFSDARSVLQSLARYLGVELTVEETEHGSFVDNRCGAVHFDGEEVGVIGEVAQTVREHWGLDVQVAAFELDVETVQTVTDPA